MPEIAIQQNIFGTGNYVVGQGTLNVIQQLPELDREGHRNLTILRDKVKQFWIRGVLEKSVHGEALIALGRQSVAEAVDHPWASTLELPDQKSQLLPSGKKTSEIFYECGRALLILGEPGSGKTISLLELASDLIQKSEVDPTQPVPVVFNLSSWSARQQPLVTWLVEELKTKYFVSRKLAEFWLQQNRLLLLLDGLDEVIAEARAACVEAIHKHVEEQGSSGIAVCCRIRDYTALPLKLKLNAAICVQPLTSAQIDQYLLHSGESLAPLRQAVNEDSVLNELAQSPLVLSIMSLAYQDVLPSQLKVDGLKTVEDRREHIFEQYVEKMFSRRQQKGRAFGKSSTKDWLAGLARQMTQRAQTMFLVEGVQPDWLPLKAEQWFFFFISRGACGAILVGFFSAFLLALIGLLPSSASDFREMFWMLAFSSSLAGLFTGMVEALLVLRRGAAKPSLWWAILLRLFSYAILAAVPVFISSKLQGDRVMRLDPVILLSALLAGSIFGVLFGVVFGVKARRQSLALDIQPVERLSWSWRRAVSGVWRSFIVGYVVCIVIVYVYTGIVGAVIGEALSAGLNFRFDSSTSVTDNSTNPTLPSFNVTNIASTSRADNVTNPPPASDPATNSLPYAPEKGGAGFHTFLSGLWDVGSRGFVGALLWGVMGSLLFGLTPGVAPAKTSANQGIRLSLRNGIRAGASIGYVLALLIWTVVMLFGKSDGFAGSLGRQFDWAGRWAAPAYTLITGTFLGLVVALWYGGFDIIQHYTLRLMLWRRGYAPCRLVRFLDHASDLILLQKVGGGYIFIHRLLLEHFAALETKWSAKPLTQKSGN